jgi:predicted lipid-binding transport protein (Tim44 family)
MMGDGFPLFDIVLFAAIAAFLILRLRSKLGRRPGDGPPRHDPLRAEPGKSKKEETVIHLADQRNERPQEGTQTAQDVETTPLQAGLAAIHAATRGFDQEEFLVGARTAFEMILRAFADGDTEFLKSLLSEDVYRNFLSAIRERDKEGETLENTLVGIRTADMIEAYMEGRNAFITVKIASEQMNVVKDEAGRIVDGDPNHIQQVTDIWTFMRDTRSRDPNWTLVATSSLD